MAVPPWEASAVEDATALASSLRPAGLGKVGWRGVTGEGTKKQAWLVVQEAASESLRRQSLSLNRHILQTAGGGQPSHARPHTSSHLARCASSTRRSSRRSLQEVGGCKPVGGHQPTKVPGVSMLVMHPVVGFPSPSQLQRCRPKVRPWPPLAHSCPTLVVKPIALTVGCAAVAVGAASAVVARVNQALDISAGAGLAIASFCRQAVDVRAGS